MSILQQRPIKNDNEIKANVLLGDVVWIWEKNYIWSFEFGNLVKSNFEYYLGTNRTLHYQSKIIFNYLLQP